MVSIVEECLAKDFFLILLLLCGRMRYLKLGCGQLDIIMVTQSLLVPLHQPFFFVKKYLLYNISIYNPVPPDIVDSESSGDIMVTEGQNATLRFVTIQIDNILDY